ncbi:MAG: NAD-binding protein, partial [Deltaproteobacteria bacterium]|nr:NAD-binding protein [Deltaproteobacteria bacterium]
AKTLGLQRPSQAGWVFLGANVLARAMAKIFREDGQEVVCIDANADHCQAAENDCTRVIYGNGLQTRTLLRAEIDTRRGALALTANDEINYLFIQKVKEQAKNIFLGTSLKYNPASLTPGMLHKTGAELLFGAPVDIELWERRFQSEQVRLQLWQYLPPKKTKSDFLPSDLTEKERFGVALRRNNQLTPLTNAIEFKKNDEVFLFVHEADIETTAGFLQEQGWRQLDGQSDRKAFTTSTCSLKEGNPD